jgi:hypothetical protein
MRVKHRCSEARMTSLRWYIMVWNTADKVATVGMCEKWRDNAWRGGVIRCMDSWTLGGEPSCR